MSSIQLKHSGGNSVSIAAPSSNPSSNRTLTVPSNADGTILTTTYPKSGNILQVVHETKTDAFTTSSTSFVDVPGMAASITPTSASSKIIVLFNIYLGGSNNAYGNAKCQRLISGGSYADLQVADALGNHVSANVAIDTEVAYGQYKGYGYSFSLQDTSHNTTSQITYKLVLKLTNGWCYFNRNYIDDASYSTAGTSSVMLMEVAGWV